MPESDRAQRRPDEGRGPSPPDPIPDAAVNHQVEYDRLEPKVWVMGGIMLALAVVALVLMLQDFSTSSYLYLAFYAIPANSAISVFPHEPVVIWYGTVGNIWWTAVAASVGTAVAGFLDHSVFVPVMNLKGLTGYKEKGWYRKAAGLFMRYPFAVIVVTGFTPIPFFPFKFLSFSLHYPLWKYLAALLLGRFPRYALLAWIGHVIRIPTWLLVAIFGGAILAYAIKAGPEIVRYLRSARAGSDDPPGPPDAPPAEPDSGGAR